MPVHEFDFDALNEYITSSRDETLRKVAKEHGKKYIGSSSSMTAVLSHFHFLLSEWRPVNMDRMSKGFGNTSTTFTRILRCPTPVFLTHKDGVYAIDADKEFDSANILMNLGKSMEKLLTLPKDQFERFRRTSENKITPEEIEDEEYHYTTLGDFLMRAQLDAYDSRLPGTGMFDLKTRAVMGVRMESRDHKQGMDYQIKGVHGTYESYEREYHDMIRAAFLKYSLQVRIGRMDGILVAFHNTQRIFGFQYISLGEMDYTLHGQEDTCLGDAEFKLSVSLWNKVLDKITARFPGESLRVHFETRENMVPFMYIFGVPVTEAEKDEIQTRNQAAVEEFQRKLLYPDLYKESESSESSEAGDKPASKESDKMPAPTEETPAGSLIFEGEMTSFGEEISHHEAVQSQDSLFETTSAEDTPSSEQSDDALHEPGEKPEKPLLAMALTIQNLVNGKKVARPKNLKPTDKWTIQYRLSEFPEPRAREAYTQCLRRRAALYKELNESSGPGERGFTGKLRRISRAGKKWRVEQDKLDEEKGIVTVE